MVYSIIALGSLCLGFGFSQLLTKIMLMMEDEKATEKVNDVYSKLLENVYGNRTVFTSRINNTISLETLIEGEGRVNVMYMMDKKDIALFKNDKCIYTSDLVRVELLEEIVTSIDFCHKNKILDTVNMMGLIFSRDEFEKKFNMKVEDMKNGMYGPMEVYDDRIDDEEIDFDIDYILDRISEVGIDNLTTYEKEFLDNYNSN